MLLTNTWAQIGLATSLVVSPATPEDWTVLKLNRRKVEREVLDQVVAFHWNRFQLMGFLRSESWLWASS